MAQMHGYLKELMEQIKDRLYLYSNDFPNFWSIYKKI